MPVKPVKRRDFIKGMALSTMSLAIPVSGFSEQKASAIKLGLVTYQWGRDWDIPTLIRNCEASKVLGVELRVHHAHGVDTYLNAKQRESVKKQFEDSAVTLVGYGTNLRFDSPDKQNLEMNISRAKALLVMDHEIGGSGVKVKPNGFHEGISHQKTIEQIGNALNEIGRFAGNLGQQVRLEVHGHETQRLPNIKAILEVADNPNVAVCWNCNPTDMEGRGFEYNFDLVKDRLGDTMHIHELNIGKYPYQKLINNLVRMDYSGWQLLECSATHPEDKVAAMIKQRKLWENRVATAG